MVVRDPIMSLVSLLVAPAAMLVLRKLVRRINAIASSQFTGGAQILETMQETVQGIRIVKAFTLEEQMQRQVRSQRRRRRARIRQDGARRQSRRAR